MLRHFRSLVPGQGLPDDRGDVVDAGDERVAQGVGVAAGGQGYGQEETAGAFHERAQSGLAGPADDQVAFPVAGHLAALGLGRVVVDGAHADDPGAGTARPAPGAPCGAAGSELDAVAFEVALGQGVDPGVDSLVGDHPVRVVVTVLATQPAGDLVGRVPAPQPVDDFGPQAAKPVQVPFFGTAAGPCGAGVGERGAVVLPAAVAADVPADHRRAPADPRGDLLLFQATSQTTEDLLPIRVGTTDGGRRSCSRQCSLLRDRLLEPAQS